MQPNFGLLSPSPRRRITVHKGVLTHRLGEGYVHSFRNTHVSGNELYNSVYPSIWHGDVLQGVLDLAGSTVIHAAALAGYVKGRSRAATPTNGVALFGLAKSERDGQHVWGINTLLQDADRRAVLTTSNRILIGAELDFNIMGTATEILGVSVGGNSLSQPTTANAFLVNNLGNGNKWTTGFWSLDGAAANGLAIGAAAASGTDVASQYVILKGFDNAAAARQATMRFVPFGGSHFLEVTSTGANFQFKISGGSLSLDTGSGVNVNGNTIISSRRTGWSVATGTATRTTFATSTVTTAQLAERVKALIDDLHQTAGHGLIGT